MVCSWIVRRHDKFGGAVRRCFQVICEKQVGGGQNLPSSSARVKSEREQSTKVGINRNDSYPPGTDCPETNIYHLARSKVQYIWHHGLHQAYILVYRTVRLVILYRSTGETTDETFMRLSLKYKVIHFDKLVQCRYVLELSSSKLGRLYRGETLRSDGRNTSQDILYLSPTAIRVSIVRPHSRTPLCSMGIPRLQCRPSAGWPKTCSSAKRVTCNGEWHPQIPGDPLCMYISTTIPPSAVEIAIYIDGTSPCHLGQFIALARCAHVFLWRYLTIKADAILNVN